MAKHRKNRLWRRTHRKPIPVALRAAATLTLAGAASATVLDSSALAEPEPSLTEVEQRVDALHGEAEEATEAFNAATEAAQRAERDLDALRDRASRHTAELNEARDAIGSQAGAEYRTGGLPASLHLALSADPEDFLRRADVVDRSDAHQARIVRDIEQRAREIERLRDEAADRAVELTEAREDADDQREVVEDRLAEAEDLLATRTAEERERLLGEDATAVATRAGSGDHHDVAPSARAASAVGFAFAQLGKPYGWGATGPDAFDCSGLTQAAWLAGGVSLPRTSYSQVSAGTRVSRDELAPGDLVFYYSGISHVGIYVGGGQIIHASRPGTPVRLAPVDSMPLTAATRPA
ncbi:C40 family peptidase [Streptomyces sp. SBT349]|uniref:C40 family peptidase n=1 Tax=Streptomyces sp. SBT349 TaxID=1580539 RepID=UPI00066E06B3|nr:C40 family peptidase [Streptomyces sp. SBT349]